MPLNIIDPANPRALKRLLDTAVGRDPAFERRVRRIVDAVRTGGDAALRRCARRFDGLTGDLLVTPEEIADGAQRVPAEVRRAIRDAARNIARVAFRQLPKHFDLEVTPGVVVEQRIEPLARVGCYVPGGRFPLPSSLLMT